MSSEDTRFVRLLARTEKIDDMFMDIEKAVSTHGRSSPEKVEEAVGVALGEYRLYIDDAVTVLGDIVKQPPQVSQRGLERLFELRRRLRIFRERVWLNFLTVATGKEDSPPCFRKGTHWGALHDLLYRAERLSSQAITCVHAPPPTPEPGPTPEAPHPGFKPIENLPHGWVRCEIDKDGAVDINQLPEEEKEAAFEAREIVKIASVEVYVHACRFLAEEVVGKIADAVDEEDSGIGPMTIPKIALRIDHDDVVQKLRSWGIRVTAGF